LRGHRHEVGLSPLAREAARAAGQGPTCDNPFRSSIVRAVETVEEALRLIEAYEPPDPPAAVDPAATAILDDLARAASDGIGR